MQDQKLYESVGKYIDKYYIDKGVINVLAYRFSNSNKIFKN